MAKGFTPIIGLAVVVALAMAAVFGSMSLANPAQAQTTGNNPPMVSDVQVEGAATSVMLTFTGNEDIVDSEWQVQYREQVPNTLFSNWMDTTDSNVTVVVADTTFVTTITVSELTPLRVYEFKIRAVDGEDGEGDESVVVLGVALTPPTGTLTLSAKAGEGEVTLTVGGGEGNITGWQYRYRTTCMSYTVPQDTDCDDEAGNPPQDDQPKDDADAGAWSSWMILADVTGATGSGKVTGLTAGTSYDFEARTINHRTIGANTFFAPHGTAAATNTGNNPAIGATPTDAPPPPVKPSFMARSTDPGKTTRYDLNFTVPKAVDTQNDDLEIKLEDFGVPSSISSGSIAITVDDVEADVGDLVQDHNFTPEDVAVSGENLIITIGDMFTRDDTKEDFEISGGSEITVVIRQSAGISNPTEAGSYGPVIKIRNNFEYDWDAEVDDVKTYPMLTEEFPRIISLSEEDGGLGDVVEATGKGFKNSTSLTFFVDKAVQRDDDNDSDTPMANDDGDPDTDDPVPNGKLELDEDVLCVAEVGGDDVGTCEFTVSSPTFKGGDNYVNAVDGRSNIAFDPAGDDSKFVLKASIAATPAGGSPGETILIQMVNFPKSKVINKVELAREAIPGSNFGTTDAEGNANFSFAIPNDVTAGKQELRVHAGDENASKSVVISGPGIKVTPGEVVANQRVSLVGSGFTAGSRIGDGEGDSSMSIGGDDILWSRINGSNDVAVDNGGNWSAAVDLPLTNATTTEGSRVIRVTDSAGRTGSVVVTIPARRVTITPSIGRVGTEAVVRGWNFPSKNDEGDSFNIQIVYDAVNGKTTVSANPDASGRFETQLRIPTTADIPSTNTVKVSFQESGNGPTVVTTVTHDVPEGGIELSTPTGPPGISVTVNGEGFKSFVPVKSVMVGSLEVTPSPRPSTDSQGMMSFDITIPGLDLGIQTIEVKVGGTTASVGFTVTPSGVSAGDIKASADAVENIGENFVRAFNFNNDTKTWTFYDPAAGDASTLENFITGESYWILIGETQEVILNNKTRNLTCVAGNCWNLIVW